MRCTEPSLNNRKAADGERDLQRAHQLISEGRWGEAEQLLRAVLRGGVESLKVEVHQAYGRVKFSQGDRRQASYHYAVAAKLSESPDGYVLAARTALDVLDDSSFNGPRNALFYYSRAVELLKDREQWERAQAVEAEMARCHVEDMPT